MDYDDLFTNAYNSDNDILVTESDVNKEDYGNRYSKKEKGHAKGGLKLKFKVGDSYKMFTSDQVHDLIENIEYNPQLWDKRHEGYKDKVEKSKTWHMVEKNLGFLMVDRGTPGSVNDAAIFNNSYLKEVLEDGSTLPAPTFWAEQVVMPSFIIGDGIFPLLTNLMKPYSRRNLSEEELKYNKVLSNARVKVEHAFGIQSGKFRCLRKELECSYDKSVDIVISLCNLHNMLLTLRQQNVSTPQVSDETLINPYSTPKEQRDALKYLINED